MSDGRGHVRGARSLVFLAVLALGAVAVHEASPSHRSARASPSTTKVPTTPLLHGAGKHGPASGQYGTDGLPQGTVGMNLGGGADAGFPAMAVEQQATVMQDIANAGTTWFRLNVPFAGEVDRSGRLDWYTTAEVTQAVAHGLKVDALLSYVPAWAKLPDGSPDVRRFAAFAAAAAAHLAPLGVRTFEIWNEPNLHGNWGRVVSPREYGDLLKASYLAIKAVVPSSTVLSGGLAPAATDSQAQSMSPLTFLTALYADGFGPYLDGIADHPYSYPDLPNTPDHWNQFHLLPLIRQLMVTHNDGAKLIWVTEYGAPTSGPNAVSPADQAKMIAEAIGDRRSWPWLGPIFVFDWQDNRPDRSFGITSHAGETKPAHAILAGVKTAVQR